MTRISVREHAPSVLVATLSAAFGVSVLQFVAIISKVLSGDGTSSDAGIIGVFLQLVAAVFIFIAVYVGAIVTANTFSTIIAGRTRTIALQRLIGSSARTQRRAIAREGLAVGAAGAVIGTLAGTAITFATVTVGVAVDFLPGELTYSYVSPQLVLPIVTVVLTTWIASWVGSRRVLVVSPMQAVGAAHEMSTAEASASTKRTVSAIALFVAGTFLLVVAIVVGLTQPAAVLIGVVGGILSFTGLIVGAHLVMPAALRVVGRLLGSSAPARLAAENAVRYPERSSRTTIGLVIAVTLVTMFVVAMQSFQNVFAAEKATDPGNYEVFDESLAAILAVFSIMIGFSALIAAVGMVNNLSLSVLQRTRELGLLRALGFTARQVRGMIVAESAQMTVAALLVGLTLGTFYGWAGAQSLLGSWNGSPTFVTPGVPPLFLVGVVVLAAVLTVVASVGPSRRATRVTPVAALALD